MYYIYLIVDPNNGEIVKGFLSNYEAMTFAGDKYSVVVITIPIEFLSR